MLAPNDTADSVIGYSGLTAILLISNYLSTLTGDTACQLRRESQGNCMKREAPHCPSPQPLKPRLACRIFTKTTCCASFCAQCAWRWMKHSCKVTNCPTKCMHLHRSWIWAQTGFFLVFFRSLSVSFEHFKLTCTLHLYSCLMGINPRQAYI